MRPDFDTFYGTLLKNSVVAGLTLTETAYAPDLRLPKHAHQSAYFCFVLEGGFTEAYGKRSRICDRSTLIYHPAGDAHADSFNAASRCFNLEINAQWLDRIEQGKAALNEPTDFRNGIFSKLAAKIYKEFSVQDDLSPLIIQGLTLEMLGETARQVTKPLNNPPRWLAQAREFLYDRFREKFSLAEIAQSVGVNETHLSREFRRYFGCTTGEYVRHLRIEFACQRLSGSNALLAEIALAAGFFDQSHFARNFKSQTGMTPQEYRRFRQSR